ENGQPLPLVPAAAYESLRLLREAQTILAAARLRSFLPTLVPRGERPAGVVAGLPRVAFLQSDRRRRRLGGETGRADGMPRLPPPRAGGRVHANTFPMTCPAVSVSRSFRPLWR